ncbi:MAG TPA: non-homologous end-joining DNA ligase [Conexibacter sp.]|jgi:bifunctional non-homologous end joining protein LigD
MSTTVAIRAGRRTVEVSRPEKELFPTGETKGDLAEYYAEIAPTMLPHVRDRPVALQRFPDGIEHQGFFQKSVAAYYPDWIKTVDVPRHGGRLVQAMLSDAATMVYLAGQACITPHVFLSRADELEQPDRLIFDLDPTDVAFAEVRRGAQLVGEALRAEGLEPFTMTTGSRGLHVTVPLRRGPDFDAVRGWARELAQQLVERDPRRFTLEARKARREAPILLDIMRNSYAQHAVAPYGVRARAGAAVAMPLHWDELDDPGLAPDRWTIHTARDRIAEHGDAWRGFASHARGLPL